MPVRKMRLRDYPRMKRAMANCKIETDRVNRPRPYRLSMYSSIVDESTTSSPENGEGVLVTICRCCSRNPVRQCISTTAGRKGAGFQPGLAASIFYMIGIHGIYGSTRG